jgi:hypothetical protein
MKYLVLISLLLSANAFACWKMQGEISIGSKIIKLDQKINHNQKYSFQEPPYLVHLSVTSQDKIETLSFEVLEKMGLELLRVSNGKMRLKENEFGILEIEDKNRLTYLKIKLNQI